MDCKDIRELLPDLAARKEASPPQAEAETQDRKTPV